MCLAEIFNRILKFYEVNEYQVMCTNKTIDILIPVAFFTGQFSSISLNVFSSLKIRKIANSKWTIETQSLFCLCLINLHNPEKAMACKCR